MFVRVYVCDYCAKIFYRYYPRMPLIRSAFISQLGHFGPLAPMRMRPTLDIHHRAFRFVHLGSG